MAEKKMNRRMFLKVSAVAALGAALGACVPAAPTATPKPAEPTKPPAAPTATPKPAAPKYKDPPMLAELVKAGKLPPIEERLPANPWVAPVAEMIGKHGGTMRRAFTGVADRWGPTKLVDRGLFWFDAKSQLAMKPRIIESWEINQDASEWTLRLRKGTKWSDGTPFTSDAFKWLFERQVLNKTLTPTVGEPWVTGTPKVTAKAEFPDAYTVKYRFAHPKPLFFVGMGGRAHPYAAGHYLQKFHIDTTPDKAALEKEYKEKGFASWDTYYNSDRVMWHLNPDLPTINAWLFKSPLSAEMFLMERNPYFWGVDSEGQQLPYVDRITHRLFSTPDVFNMWIVNGEIDFQARHTSFGNYTLYKENEKKGDYQVFLGVGAGHWALNINHTTKNKRLREFFGIRDVRIALSLAVNRAEINDLIFDGLATPRQYTPISKSPQYHAKASNAYIEYDPKKANELLDKAGYSKKDAQGFRLWKDSTEPISFIFEGTAAAGTPEEDGAQMVAKYLAAVGIKATYKYFERALYTQHYSANEIEAAWWGGDRTVLPLVAPIIWIGTQPDRPWAVAWGFWRTDPTNPNAEEPPKDHFIRKIWDIWDNKVAVEPDAAKQTEYFKQLLDVWAEEIPYPAFLGEIPAPIIVKNGFRNYLKGYPLDDPTGDEHLLNTETYFWEDPSKHSG